MRRRFQVQPRLILMTGVAGSGKTTLAKKIVPRLWAVYLDNNLIVDGLFRDTRRGKAYESLRPYFYQSLYAITEENLKLRNSVLLDVPHVKEMQLAEWRRFIKRMTTRTKAQLVVIKCICSERTLRSRIRSRGEARDRWKLAHWKAFMREQPIQFPLRFPHIDIDTEKNLSNNVRTAIRYITNRRTQAA